MWIRENDMRSVARLWHDLSEMPASRPDEAMRHCLEGLTVLVGTCNAFWIGATRESSHDPRDPLHGWRSKAIFTLHVSDDTNRRQARIYEQFEQAEIDPHTLALIAKAGKTRSFLRSELVDDTTWSKSWLYDEVFRPLGIRDRLVGAHAVNLRSESYFGFDRTKTDKPFGDRERDILRLFLYGNPAFFREQMCVRGLTGAHTGLTPREQDVLRMLLTDRSERDIGLALGLTTNTVHQYVVSLCRKLGVKGRLGLMAYWLRYDAAETDDSLGHGGRPAAGRSTKPTGDRR